MEKRAIYYAIPRETIDGLVELTKREVGSDKVDSWRKEARKIYVEQLKEMIDSEDEFVSNFVLRKYLDYACVVQ